MLCLHCYATDYKSDSSQYKFDKGNKFSMVVLLIITTDSDTEMHMYKMSVEAKLFSVCSIL